MKSEGAPQNDDGFTSLIITTIELGTLVLRKRLFFHMNRMSIKDSTWKNTEYRGFLGNSINVLTVPSSLSQGP